MADPTIKDLLRKLSGKKVQLSTRCGSFKQASGVIREVFDEFVLFTTQDERLADQPASRHWVWIANIGVLTEDNMVKTEEVVVSRYGF